MTIQSKWIWGILFSVLTMSSGYGIDKKNTSDTRKKPVQERPKVKQGERPEPVVTIKETKQTTVKEYRINGQLRAVKITPKNGMPAYYLIDTKGTGEFVRMGPDVGADQQIPKWIFYEWD